MEIHPCFQRHLFGRRTKPYLLTPRQSELLGKITNKTMEIHEKLSWNKTKNNTTLRIQILFKYNLQLWLLECNNSKIACYNSLSLRWKHFPVATSCLPFHLLRDSSVNCLMSKMSVPDLYHLVSFSAKQTENTREINGWWTIAAQDNEM